jgi:hypothetical protein
MTSDKPKFDALNAVWGAYWALVARLDRFAYFVVIWSAVGAVVAVVVPEVLEWSLEGRPDLAGAPLSTLLGGLAAFVVLVAASICMSIAWHRWIILGEPLNRVFPERTDILAAYTWRVVVVVALVPAALSVAAIVWMMRNRVVAEDVSGADAVVYIGTTLVVAALARSLLAFAAVAVGDKELTFLAAWRLTTGHWWRFFLGYLACDLPFTMTMLWLNDLIAGPADESFARSAVEYLATVVDVMGSLVCAAFLSFAYLHFTSGRPSAREPAGYFS